MLYSYQLPSHQKKLLKAYVRNDQNLKFTMKV